VTSTERAPRLVGFEYVRELGSGGYADVYLYRQLSPAREVAVKVLRTVGLTAAVRRQFVAEANAMAGFGRHPHIVQIFEVDESADGRPYLTMEFYPGDHLGVRLARLGRLSVDEVLSTGVQIAGAVHTAHLAGVLHRDIKPANILVSVAEDPGLSDFGIAGRGTDDEEDLGVSIPWSPPEVLAGESNGTVRSDVYSLAATLWHLLVGRPPFALPGGADSQPAALIRRITEVPAPATGRGDVPASLDRLLRQAMAKDPALRPATALELARGLQQVEQELRLPQTKVVSLDGARTSHVPVQGGVDATRMRGARVVRTEPDLVAGTGHALTQDRTSRKPSLPVEPPRFAAPPGLAVPVRTPSGERAEPGTVLRPRVVDAPPAPTAPQPAPPASRRRVLLIAAAVLLGVVGVLAVVARPHRPATGSPTVGTPQPDPPIETGSVTPAVTVRRVGDRYVFSWTPALPDTSAYYKWMRLDAVKPVETKTRKQSVSLPAAGQVCIQVTLVTASSVIDATPSARVCGRG
jgi:serine/threonine protein kinase